MSPVIGGNVKNSKVVTVGLSLCNENLFKS